MKLTVAVAEIISVKTDTLLILVPEFDRLDKANLKDLNAASGGAIETLMTSEEFTGKEAQFATLYSVGGFQARRIMLVGLGVAGKVDADAFRRAMGRAAGQNGLTKARSAAFYLGKYQKPEFYQAAIEGYLLGAYKNLEYKSDESKSANSHPAEITFVADRRPQMKSMEKAIEKGRIIAEGALLVRDLAAAPGNYLNPTIYADKARKLAKKYGLSCQVLDEAAIKKEKMGAFLSVTKGSKQPPRFLILKYDGLGGKQKPIVLVGKGITFDSGGISLKAGLNMHEMKQDMTGSAVVLSTIVTAARLGVKRNLVALIPACENMPSGEATRPGDIVTSRKGKTIEIINTDAEGRLILADALDYANKFDPQAVIDVATLTGASLYVLGYAGAPILGNNGTLLDRIKDASDNTAELVWPLPIWDEHRDLMKSDYADLKNSAGKPSGTIAAAAFLENFIGDWPWAHIDIAYMDLEPKGRPYTPRGASGWGLRLLIDLLSNWKKV